MCGFVLNQGVQMGNNQTITLFSFSLYRPTSFMRLLLFLSFQIKFQQIIKSVLGMSVTNIISCQWLICLFHHSNHKLWTLFNAEASFCCPQEKERHGWIPCSPVQGLLLLPSLHWLPLLPPGLKGREKRRTRKRTGTMVLLTGTRLTVKFSDHV